MFRVLVVDDEPSAVEYISNIIRLKCPELTVVSTAGNGEEGLEKFRKCMPDLVISDVKMPVMDGLDMVKAMKAADEDVSIMLVSGYQEFEYVRRALQYGVSDYIVKPMTPAGFGAAVEPVIKKMHQKVYEKRKKLARSMIMGEEAKEEQIKRYFTKKAYYVAVIRENGLPRRFTDTHETELVSEPGNTMFVYGRDEREALYICPEEVVSQKGFRSFIEKEGQKKKGRSNFITTVIADKPVLSESLGSMVGRLYGELNRRISMGVTQSVAVPDENRPKDMGGKFRGEEIMKNMERLLEKRDFGRILEEFSHVIQKAEEMRYPQLYLEQTIRQMMEKIQHYFKGRSDMLEEEMMFEDAFYDAGTSEELFEGIKSILVPYWKKDKEMVKLDSPEFLERIKEYIDDHLASELTVSSVCREFNLSQSYLNLIFRKHGMESFSTYLRNTRIQRAKEIMDRNPQMFIKDVAEMVGYRDQFYFSRIFRAVTGISPSSYDRS